MKKIILSVCAALMLFCGGASAKISTMKSSMASVTGGNVDYDAVTGKFEWKAQWGNAMELFKNLEGQVSKYKHLKIKLTDPTHGYRLLFYKKGASIVSARENMNAENTTVDLDLTTLKFEDGSTINDIDRICIAGSDDGVFGSFTIMPADVTLETDDIETLTVTTTVDANSDINTPFQWYKGTEPRTLPVENNIGKTGDGISVLWGYGYNNSEDEGYFNLNGYSALRVKVNNFDATKNKTFRVLGPDKTYSLINMTGDETLAPFSVSKCTSLKSGGWGQNVEQEITSIDFIGEYQAVNTESPFAIAASKGSNISYDRIFTKNQACTVCLPFALSAEELANVGKAYTLSAVSGSKATFTPVEAIEAYKPYLLIPSADGKLLEEIAATKDIADVPAEAKTSVSGGYSFVGTLQAKESVKTTSTEVYGFSANEGKFVRASEKASIDAFRAYISVPTAALSTAASRSIDLDFGGTTGINEIQNAQSSSAQATYDVAGKRVGKNYKGVVVSNGKKKIQK